MHRMDKLTMVHPYINGILLSNKLEQIIHTRDNAGDSQSSRLSERNQTQKITDSMILYNTIYDIVAKAKL